MRVYPSDDIKFLKYVSSPEYIFPPCTQWNEMYIKDSFRANSA
jgi:hypothetical protein